MIVVLHGQDRRVHDNKHVCILILGTLGGSGGRLLTQPMNVSQVRYNEFLICNQGLNTCDTECRWVVLDGFRALSELREFQRVQIRTCQVIIVRNINIIAQ